MKKVFVNLMAEIKGGACAGHVGRVVGYNSETDIVELEIDEQTYIHTISENIEQ